MNVTWHPKEVGGTVEIAEMAPLELEVVVLDDEAAVGVWVDSYTRALLLILDQADA